MTKVGADAFKTASKRVIQEAAEAIAESTGNKLADVVAKSYNGDRITRTTSQNIPETNSINGLNSTLQTKRNTYHRKKRQQIVDDLRLI